MSTEYRNYSYDVNNIIYKTYRKARSNQTLDFVKQRHIEFNNRIKEKMNLWDILKKLTSFVDISDPDVSIPNSYHAFQTAEKARTDGMPDWFILTCLLHDFGKIMVLFGHAINGTSMDTQWATVGDTFIVGAPIPNSIVYPEFNKLNKDHRKYLHSYTDVTEDNPEKHLGVYSSHCGLCNVYCSWGHDEFLYKVLRGNKNSLPDEAYYIIRFHSLYVWHKENEYTIFENEKDRRIKSWVQKFNKYDLYTKENSTFSIEVLQDYYTNLFLTYFPSLELLV